MDNTHGRKNHEVGDCCMIDTLEAIAPKKETLISENKSLIDLVSFVLGQTISMRSASFVRLI